MNGVMYVILQKFDFKKNWTLGNACNMCNICNIAKFDFEKIVTRVMHVICVIYVILKSDFKKIWTQVMHVICVIYVISKNFSLKKLGKKCVDPANIWVKKVLGPQKMGLKRKYNMN